MPFSKGSSTTTAVLLEAVRAGTAPAAILTTGPDTFFALASIVADVMYGKSFPVIALGAADFASLRTGERLKIEASLRRIVDFRNRIIHGYDAVDDVIVWSTVERHLPVLLAEVEALLREDH